jgi:hypothetical protein
MSFFKDIDLNDVTLRMHQLNNEESSTTEIKLNSKQINFMKRYHKFQIRLLKKIMKDNHIKDGYAIVVPIKGAGHPNTYILISKNIFYCVKEDASVLYKYRMIRDKLLLEFSLFPSPAFEPIKVMSYKLFFSDLFKHIENILAFPTQFLVATKDGVTYKTVDDKVTFAQIHKYL